MKRRLLLGALGMALAATAMARTAQDRYDAARDDYEVGHFAQAFAVFAELADAGHCEAARMAHQMARYGRALYAIDFGAAPERITRWQGLPGCGAAGPGPR